MSNTTSKQNNEISGWPAGQQPVVNIAAFEKQRTLAPARWKQAFDLLETCGFFNLEPGRYEIDGSNLFFMVNHYITKPSEEVLFEAHRDYADIQYVYEGEELIGVAPLLQGKEILPYDPEKDIAFYDVKEAEHYKAAADRLFILFPDDLHQPGVMTRMPEPVKKVVIKVKLETERLAMSN